MYFLEKNLPYFSTTSFTFQDSVYARRHIAFFTFEFFNLHQCLVCSFTDTFVICQTLLCFVTGSGDIDFPTFSAMMQRYQKMHPEIHLEVQSTAAASDTGSLRQQFGAFDKDGDGYISPEDLRDTMKTLGLQLTEEDLRVMMNEAGIGPQGRINFKGML